VHAVRVQKIHEGVWIVDDQSYKTVALCVSGSCNSFTPSGVPCGANAQLLNLHIGWFCSIPEPEHLHHHVPCACCRAPGISQTCCTAFSVLQKNKIFSANSGWLNEDTLELRVEVKVLVTAGQPEPTRVNPLLAYDVEVPPPSMAADIGEALDDGGCH
jgi:hypothetical protein